MTPTICGTFSPTFDRYPNPFLSHGYLRPQEDITTVVRSSDHSKSSSLELHSSSSLKKTNETGQVDKLGSAVTTVFESSRELVPQSYAGNATHTTEVDPALSRCNTLGYLKYLRRTFQAVWQLREVICSST